MNVNCLRSCGTAMQAKRSPRSHLDGLSSPGGGPRLRSERCWVPGGRLDPADPGVECTVHKERIISPRPKKAFSHVQSLVTGITARSSRT